jgi:hypothetical protein
VREIRDGLRQKLFSIFQMPPLAGAAPDSGSLDVP